MKTKFKSSIRAACHSFGGIVCAGAFLLIAGGASAQIYNVNRSFTDGVNTATLVGTLQIPIGNYTIQNSGASPFTSVNLTLTVGGTPYTIDNVLTGIILGTGQFFIDATPTMLTFNTANSDFSNPADLEFSDTLGNDTYIIGSDGDPHFEHALTGTGNVLSTTVSFPTVFGTAVPEPGSIALLGLGLLGLVGYVGVNRNRGGLINSPGRLRVGREFRPVPEPPTSPHSKFDAVHTILTAGISLP